MKKKFKKELNKYFLWILIGSTLPLIIYFFIFGANGISFKNSNWSDFGSFISGYGTLIFGACNLYFLIKVAYTINHLDHKRNNQNKIDSVKPLGILSHEINYKNLSYKIIINNFGLGPLIIKNYNIKYNKTIYNNFSELTSNSISHLIKNNTSFVGANNYYVVFEVVYDKIETENTSVLNSTYEEKFNELINKMKLVELTFECEDIYENKVELLIK